MSDDKQDLCRVCGGERQAICAGCHQLTCRDCYLVAINEPILGLVDAQLCVTCVSELYRSGDHKSIAGADGFLLAAKLEQVKTEHWIARLKYAWQFSCLKNYWDRDDEQCQCEEPEDGKT